MRAIYIFNYLLILFLYSCSTVEVAKELTKVTSSVKTSIKKIATDKEGAEDSIQEIKKEELIKEKQKIITEKKKTKEVIVKQSQITKIEIIGKKIDQLKIEFGEPNFTRVDGNTTTIRFDTESCRLFVFFNSAINKSKSQYFEIRNKNGNLIENKNDIEKCLIENKKT